MRSRSVRQAGGQAVSNAARICVHPCAKTAHAHTSGHSQVRGTRRYPWSPHRHAFPRPPKPRRSILNVASVLRELRRRFSPQQVELRLEYMEVGVPAAPWWCTPPGATEDGGRFYPGAAQ